MLGLSHCFIEYMIMGIEQIRADIIRRVIGIEGGYVNNPRDSGGATRWGITAATARAYGLDVRSLTPDQATHIYYVGYWQKLNLDGVASLSPAVAEELFDSGVNLGVVKAGIWLQRCLNVLNRHGQLWADLVVDGDIGAATLGALDTFFRVRGNRAEGVMLNMLNGLQSEFYIDLAERRPKDEEFQMGWQQNRVGDVRVDSPEQLFGGDTIPTAGMGSPVAYPLPTEPMVQPQPAEEMKKRWPILDWLPGMKTHLVAVAGVGLSVAELMGYTIPSPVYALLASLGVSTVYRGWQRSVRG